MAVTVGKLAQYMETLAPCRLAEDWDNVGLLVGNSTYDVRRVLLALDATMDVVNEAVQKDCQMLITHHPITRSGLKQINDSSVLGKKIMTLIENKIALYSAHTNLDNTDGGVNDTLCTLLGIEVTKIDKAENGDNKTVRYGKLASPMTFGALASRVKDALELQYLPTVGPFERVVETVALVGGNGIGYMSQVLASGVDVFITGDIRYHDGNTAIEENLCMIDFTHYGSEVTITKRLQEYLSKAMAEDGCSAELILSEINGQPFRLSQ